MANKLTKRVVIALALLASVTALGACDKIEAKLSDDDYNSKILELDGVTNNTLKRIYDTVVAAGSTNSEKVLNNVLLALSESQFGSFYDDGETKGLNTIQADDSLVDAFVAAHSVYADDDVAISRARVRFFYDSLVERIQKAFLAIVQTSTYQDRGSFYEKKFYKATKGDLYDLGTIADADFKIVQIDGADTYEDVAKYFNADFLTIYQDYIERSVLPSIMRSALIQQYLYTKNYGTLGRSYARKVQYVSLADNSNYPFAAQKLVKAFAKDVLQVGGTVDDVDLSLLGDLYKGYFDWSSLTVAKKTLIEQIYTDAGFTKVVAPAGVAYTDYYKETTYGGYVTDYVKITDSRFTTDTTIYNDFTNSGTYAPQVGLQIKTGSLIAADKTTEGWYTSSGLSSLPTDIRTRLFKISVANEVDTNVSDVIKDERTYGWYVKGHYYITPSSYESTADTPYCIYDSSSTSWYIVRVDEAVKTAKLSDGSGSYDELHPTDKIFREKVAREVAYILADNETYKKTANQYYVEQAALSYHDQDVYDYFETTFPDLFDD